jgi:MoxR-like ATPase
MKVIVNYPSFQEEVQIVELVTSKAKDEKISAVLNLVQLEELRRLCQEVYVDPKVFRYVVALVQASREPKKLGLDGMIEWGASPRASIALIAAARSLAFIRGKKFITPDEVKELAPDVLRHRILPSFEGEARGITPDEIVGVILRSVTVP